MSQPRHAKSGDIRRAVPPSTQAVTPPDPDDERVAGTWRPLHAVPDPLPAPEPEEPAARSTWEAVTYGLLTDSELSMSHRWDPDFLPGIANFDPLLDQDHLRWAMFDQAIDREPEIE
jgi:hypothetical protein